LIKAPADITFAVGIKDKPVWLHRGTSYKGLIDWISAQPIVFYDVDSHRAWLGDGASALLHLVRISIERDRNQPAYRSSWKFDGTLEGSQERSASLSAIEILNNFRNLNRQIYLDDVRPDDNGNLVEIHHRFRDRVLKILHDLELLIDYQAQVAARDGYWFRQSTKVFVKRLMGFDVWDVAKPTGPIFQRIHHLQTGGHGCADFVNSIKALVIFGNNFGDLLQPVAHATLLDNWKTVPKNRDYLGVTIETLKMLHRTRKSDFLDVGEIVSGFLWCSRCELFSSCTCLEKSPTAASDPCPVQLLLPRKQNVLLEVPNDHITVSLTKVDSEGAVVFGHTPYRIGPRHKSGQQAIFDERSASVSATTTSNEPGSQSQTSSVNSPESTVNLPSPDPRISAGKNEPGTNKRENRRFSLGFFKRL
jgi:hypothetical protein